MARVFVLIDCSIPINTRNQKIINSIKEQIPDSVVHIITWNREGLSLQENEMYHAFNQLSPYADVNAKLKGMLGFKKYIGQTLEAISADVIIASHWSNLVLASGFKKDGQILIYENLDIPTAGLFFRYFSRVLEFRSLKKVDLIINASRFFKELYPKNTSQLILENKPTFKPSFKNESFSSPLNIAYIGSIRYKEILVNLVNAVRNDKKYILYFHGSGEDLNVMQNYCKGITNVFFTGKYNYSTINSLYHQSDIIWAGYPNKDFNVVYAISNKFHESMYVGVPCVYSDKTKLADFVKFNNLGFVVDPYSVESIRCLFERLSNDPTELINVRQSMIEFQKTDPTWDDDFKKILPYLR